MLRTFFIQHPSPVWGPLSALLRNNPELRSARPTIKQSFQLFPSLPLPALLGVVALPQVVQTIQRVYPGYYIDTLDNGMVVIAIPINLATFLERRDGTPPKGVFAELHQQILSLISALDAAQRA